MEGEGARELDLAGMILHCREEITRIEIEIGRLEEERTERETDMEALERVQKLSDRETPAPVRATTEEMARHIAGIMQSVRISLITPKDAVDLIGDVAFLKGLSAKTRHVYVTRALNYEPVFRKEGRGEYSIVVDATMPLPLTH